MDENKFKVFSVDKETEDKLSYWIGEHASKDAAVEHAFKIIKNELVDAAIDTNCGRIIKIEAHQLESDNGIIIHYKRDVDGFESNIYILETETE